MILLRLESQSIANGIVLNAWSPIGKRHLLRRRVVSDEPALLENASRWAMVRMAERLQSLDAYPSSNIEQR
ncbi:MAG: hypothetical protein WC815_16990 [Vicinamibacterales bacterium]